MYRTTPHYVRTVYEYVYAQSWETTSDFTANPVYDVATNESYDLKEGSFIPRQHLVCCMRGL